MTNYSLFLFLIGSRLGFVQTCTLKGKINYVKINGRQYCVVDKGIHRHSEAVEICKKLNARLPLPRDQTEAHGFMSLKGFSKYNKKPYKVWINVDARNPKKSNKKSEWVDAVGLPLGNRAVYLRVIILFLFLSSANLFTMITDPFQSGRLENREQVIQ